MPADEALKREIQTRLIAFASQPLRSAGTAFWKALGYASQRALALRGKADFRHHFDSANQLNEKLAHWAEWQEVEFLFQLTDDDIRAANSTLSLFESATRVDNQDIRSYVFFAIRLSGGRYTRTQLSGVTRALNRLLPMPALVLFRHGETLTLAAINRRIHKREESRDVLEKVTLIKDIALAKPHRAHLEILADLALASLSKKHTVTDFVSLHRAWQKTLDTYELNKRFYQQLQHWYFWALGHVRFPKDAPKDADGRDSLSLIRLLTRLIFVWFVKEKGFVPEALFDERRLAALLKEFAPRDRRRRDSVFYRAILQNLFFATLNQEPDQRGWAREGQNFMAHSLYRHRDDFADTATALDCFKDIPFLNGGLFECLDKTEGTPEKPRYIRIDGFSRRTDSQPCVPDFLFFGDEEDADLSEFFGEKKSRPARVRGLLRILGDFKFTIEENTPIEEEVALDPACDSGAFPMGVLHRLVALLAKLDPGNARWKQRQLDKAAEIPDPTVRERVLADIEQAFTANELDYGRKLYLIENCLYGVDIQPIAVQITKLRFFISLVVDQCENPAAPNRGIRPLPNLETKIVAANTLIGIEKKERQGDFLTEDTAALQKLKALRERLAKVRDDHFLARTTKTKAKCREQDATLRQEMSGLLQAAGLSAAWSRQLAAWDPYDQNAHAEFFDLEWMFGLASGFDIVVGNPPYNAELTDTERAFFKARFESVSSGRQDTAAIFVERGSQLCRRAGQISFILPYRLFSRKRNHGQFQIWLLINCALAEVIYLGAEIGFTANDEFMTIRVGCEQPQKDAMTSVAWKPLLNGIEPIRFQTISQAAFLQYGEINLNLLRFDQVLLSKIANGAAELETVCKVRDGIVPHIRERLVSETKKDRRYVRFAGIAGCYVLQPYLFTCDSLWLCYDINEARKFISDPVELRKVQLREKEIFLTRKIVTAQNSAVLKGAIDEDKTFVSNSIHSTYLRDEWGGRLALEYILALINSKLLNYFHDALRVKATDLHPQILVGNLKKLPIRVVGVAQQQRIVSLVNNVIASKKRRSDTSALEREIDQHVYALYGLTPEEIQIVEGTGTSPAAPPAPEHV